MDPGVRDITIKYMNYFLNETLLKPQILEGYDGQAMFSVCWAIILSNKLSLLNPDWCIRVGRPRLNWMK
jgi:hypothetical protein